MTQVMSESKGREFWTAIVIRTPFSDVFRATSRQRVATYRAYKETASRPNHQFQKSLNSSFDEIEIVF